MSMIRLDPDEAVVPEDLGDRVAGVDEDMKMSIRDILREVERSAQ